MFISYSASASRTQEVDCPGEAADAEKSVFKPAADRKRTRKLKETSLVDEFPMCGDAMDSLVM